MLKRIKFQTSIDGRGNYSGQTAEQLKEALAAHFGGCLVEITITGVPRQPENWRRMYYKLQVLPAFVYGFMKAGNPVDPQNPEHLESANDYLARTCNGEHEEENAIGQKIKVANDPEKLSDRDYAGFVAKAEAEIFRLFGFQVAAFQREEAKWEQYQRPPMAVHHGKSPVRMDGESGDNRKPGLTSGTSE